jgi:hypothetical protein
MLQVLQAAIEIPFKISVCRRNSAGCAAASPKPAMAGAWLRLPLDRYHGTDCAGSVSRVPRLDERVQNRFLSPFRHFRKHLRTVSPDSPSAMGATMESASVCMPTLAALKINVN